MLAIYVYRDGEVVALSDEDALKVVAAAMGRGFSVVTSTDSYLRADYENIPGKFNINIQIEG